MKEYRRAGKKHSAQCHHLAFQKRASASHREESCSRVSKSPGIDETIHFARGVARRNVKKKRRQGAGSLASTMDLAGRYTFALANRLRTGQRLSQGVQQPACRFLGIYFTVKIGSGESHA